MRPTAASPFRPRVEALEDRVTPVLDPYTPNPVPGFVTTDGVPLDGVVQLNWMTASGQTRVASGAFLGDDERRGPTDAMTQLTRAGNAQYILTAAHVLTNEVGAIDVPALTVSFYLPSRPDPFTFTVTADQYRIHPAWSGQSVFGNDIALIDLRQIGPVGPNGIGATPYAINTVADEVRSQFEFSGFGNTGNGTDGQVRGTSGVKRLGYNVFDAVLGSQIAYDYDSGDPWDNTLFWAGSAQTPVKSHDSFGGQGDSGGPAFLYDAVAGLSSWVLGESSPPDHDFGDIGFMERVSAHRDWIRGHLSVPRGVTLNMANQPFGNDGRTDRIEVRREDSRVVVYVNGYFWVDLPSAGVTSFTLLGSGDNENFAIDSGLREAVTVDGGGGVNRLSVTNSPSTLTYTVDAARVNAVSFGLWQTTIDYWNLQGIEVLGDAADRARVYAVRAGTPVTVTGAGTVDLGVRGTGSLGSIADGVTVNGNGSTTLFVNDDAWTAPRRYALSLNQLDVDRFTSTWTTISFGGLSVMELNGGSGGNTTTVTSTPASITRLYTGGGVDTTDVRGTSGGVLAIDGQAGNDTVNLGSNGRVQAVGGSVRIDNETGFTTVNADNSSDTRAKTVTMQAAANGYISITGLTPGTVRVARDAVRRLNLWTGAGNDTFVVNDTPNNFAPLSFGTTVRSGGGNDVFNVNGTSGWLAVETGGGADNLVRVGNNANALNLIAGEVSVDGAGGNTSLFVNDASSAATPTNPFYSYVLSGDLIRRLDRASINHRNLSGVTLITSQTADIVNVLGTIPDVPGGRGTTVLTGPGDDLVAIAGTGGYLRVDTGSGFGNVTAGSKVSSLDAIRGPVDVSGADFAVTISNEASTTRQTALVTQSTLFGQPAQTVTRQELRGGENVVLNTFNVLATGKAGVTYFAGQGGDSLFATGTQANVFTTLVGSPFATEVLAVGFGSDTRQIQGPVTLRGQAANNDVAYYYDFLNPTAQSYGVYGFQAGPEPDLQVTGKGVAAVDFVGFNGVSFLTPVGGGSTIEVFGTPAGTQLGIAANAGDYIVVGSSGAALGGTVDTILGHVFVSSGNATMVVDDSGSKTAREARLTSYEFFGNTYGRIDGLAPGGISFVDRPLWNVDVRLGHQNDYFLMNGDPLATRMRIFGGAGNDVLVGSGGNVLHGEAGSDLLIAGATASFLYGDDLFTSVGAGEDILIGGTTVHGTDRAKLGEIMDVWTSGASYETRTATLRNGLLGADSVSGNGGGNILYGMWEDDLFFLSVDLDENDLYFYGLNPNEQFVPL